MGIDVWFERPLASDIRADRDKVTEAVRVPTPATSARRVAPLSDEQPVSTIRPVAKPVILTTQEVPLKTIVGRLEGKAPEDKAPEDKAPEEKAPVEPFVLACVAGNGVVLLTRGPLLKNQQRMARDIVLAVMRIRRTATVDVRFVDYRYPPAADLGVGRMGTPDRALRAFLSAQRQGVTDQLESRDGDRDGQILITEDAHSLFKDWLMERHSVIPGLVSLAGDAAQKRALWRRLSASV